MWRQSWLHVNHRELKRSALGVQQASFRPSPAARATQARRILAISQHATATWFSCHVKLIIKIKRHKEDRRLVLSLVHLRGEGTLQRLLTAGVERSYQLNASLRLMVGIIKRNTRFSNWCCQRRRPLLATRRNAWARTGPFVRFWFCLAG